MAGHVVQHLAEYRANAVLVIPAQIPIDFHWSVRSVEVAPRNAPGVFQWPSSRGLRDWRYPRWAMIAYELDFRRSILCVWCLGYPPQLPKVYR